MNRSLLATSLGLCAVASLGAAYGGLAGSAAVDSAPVAARSHAEAPTQAPALAVVSSSPEVERLEARRQLYESVDALVQASEFEKARRLLDEDEERYGDDLAPEWRDLEQSYRLMADCLERPTPQLRVRAEAFALVSQAVSLKPRILAACSSKTDAR